MFAALGRTGEIYLNAGFVVCCLLVCLAAVLDPAPEGA
jgi:hypothetical protein